MMMWEDTSDTQLLGRSSWVASSEKGTRDPEEKNNII